MHKSKKKYAAPTVPEPVANTSSASTAPEVSTKSAKEVECQRDGEDFVRNGTNEDPEKRVTKEETTAAKQKDEVDANTRASPHVHEVIHYSPHGTVRASTFSPPPDSDMPYVERKSNIVLNDSTGYKTIRVTMFDGTVGRSKAPLLSEVFATPAYTPTADESATPDLILNKGLEKSASVVTAPPKTSASTPTPKRPSQGPAGPSVAANKPQSLASTSPLLKKPSEQPFPDDIGEMRKAAEITRDYETLKVKFDLWQALQSRSRNSSEARQLHMELIQQHDSLMKKLQQVTDTVPSAKKRPSIATDTFSPRYMAGSSNTLSQLSRPPKSLEPRRQIANRAQHPPSAAPPSQHSLSPTASTSSEDTERSLVISRTSRSITTDRATAVVTRREEEKRDKKKTHARREQVASVDALSRKEERERALQRIVEEVNELKRKEHELREISGSLAVRPRRPAPTLAIPTRKDVVEHHAVRRSDGVPRPSPQKAFHQRTPSDGNNNSVRTSSTTPTGSSPIVRRNNHVTTKPRIVHHKKVYDSPRSSEVMYGTWSGTNPFVPQGRHPQGMQKQKLEKVEKYRPFTPPLSKSSQSLISPGISKESFTLPRTLQASSSSLHPQLNAQSRTDKTSPKLPVAALRAFPFDTPGSPSPPLTPNTESNIRKVKEAVRQQTLGHKGGKSLLQSETSSSDGSRSTIRTSTGGSSQGSASRTSANTVEITNNISKTLKEGLPALKKVGAPLEKSGIAVGKVIDSTRDSNTESTLRTNEYKTVYAQLPPTPPSPPPVRSPPPPPPPPPSLLGHLASREPPAVRSLPHSTSLVSTRDLEYQKAKLKPAAATERPVAPLDVRDSLMAEIRNAGGLRALRRTQS